MRSAPLPRSPGQRIPRKAKPSSTIKTSTYRPHVCAEDRLGSWTTPFSHRFRADLNNQLSAEASVSLTRAMLSSLEPGTRKNYGAGLLRFTQFCDQHDIGEDARMPASDALLAAFIARWHGEVSRSTIDTWIAGLTFWHALNGAPWNGDRMLRAVCKAALKRQPTPRDKRPPVTIQHMYALREGLDLTSSLDSSVYGSACAAFWGARRLCELMPPTPTAFDPSRHVAKGADLKYKTLPACGEFATLPIPFTKTTTTRGALLTFPAVEDHTAPVPAIKHHRQVNASVPDDAPFFAYATNEDPRGWAPMNREWFMARCNEVWAAAGLQTLTGHSFRIGGATELLLRGVPPEIVQVLGGWKSQAFLEYWRSIDDILPLFISGSFTASRLQLLRDSMTRYEARFRSSS